MNDGGVTSGIRVVSVGRILGNCFILSHSQGVEYDTDIFTGDSVARTHVRKSSHSRKVTFTSVSSLARKCILHELSNLSLRVSRSVGVISYKMRARIAPSNTKVRVTPERRLDNVTMSFKCLCYPAQVYIGVCMCAYVCVLRACVCVCVCVAR